MLCKVAEQDGDSVSTTVKVKSIKQRKGNTCSEDGLSEVNGGRSEREGNDERRRSRER